MASSGKNSDDVANALNAMLSGEHVDAEHHEEHADHPAEPAPAAPPPPPARRAAPTAPASAATPPAPARPAAPKAEAPKAAAPAPARSSAPAAPQQAAPAASRRPTTPALGTPAAPATPAPQQPQQPARSSRPSRPTAPAPAAVPAAAQSAGENAPVIDYAKQKKTPARKSTVASLEFRRTLIPPCLVVGLAFPLLTLMFFLQPSTSALRHASNMIPIIIALVGFAVLAVGVLNMLMVKKELDAQRQAKKAATSGAK